MSQPIQINVNVTVVRVKARDPDRWLRELDKLIERRRKK